MRQIKQPRRRERALIPGKRLPEGADARRDPNYNPWLSKEVARRVDGARDLLDELRTGAEPARVLGPDPVPGYGLSVNGAPCSPDCCGV